jgi:hypothetical protein
MKYTAKEYHIWKHKASNKAIGKIVEIKGNDNINNYEEVELPELFKRMVDVIRKWRISNN